MEDDRVDGVFSAHFIFGTLHFGLLNKRAPCSRFNQRKRFGASHAAVKR